MTLRIIKGEGVLAGGLAPWVWICLFTAIIMFQNSIVNAESSSEIRYLKSGSGKISGNVVLVPKANGSDLTSKGTWSIRLKLDGKEIPNTFGPIAKGATESGGSFTGLTDGPHTAIQEVLGCGGSAKETCRILFVVDTKPPKLELVEPEGESIPKTRASFLVKFNDEGSGIPSTTEEMKIDAKINGLATTLDVGEKGGERFLVVASKEGIWKPGQSVELHVKIEDRAGNSAELKKTFKVQPDDNTLIDIRGRPCEHASWEMPTKFIGPFPIRTLPPKFISFGRNTRRYTFDILVSTLALHQYNSEKELLKTLKVSSNHSDLEIIHHDIPEGSSYAKYTVKQKRVVNAEDHLGSITVSYPRTVEIEFAHSCRNGYPYNTLKKLSTSKDRISLSIPVFLHWETEYSDKVFVENNLIKYQVRFDGPGGLDEAASWFKFSGKRFWLKEIGPGLYEAQGPAREGLHHWSSGLSTSRGKWGATLEGMLTNGGTCLKKDGDILVKLNPPLIEKFFYDPERQRFQAAAFDQGTKPRDLVVNLDVAGFGQVPVALNPLSGSMEALFPLPKGIRQATLSVTDLAGQRTQRNCLVLGKPPDKKIVVREQGYPITYGVSRLGKKALNLPPSNVTWRYTKEYVKGKQRVIECRRVPLSLRASLERFVAELRRTRKVGVSTGALDNCIQSAISNAKSEAEGMSAILACVRRYDSYQNSAKLDSYSPDHSGACSSIWLDMLPPRILNIRYHPSIGEVTADIDDHGASLSELSISYSARNSPSCSSQSTAHPPFSFNTETGHFKGKFVIPSDSTCERFEVTVTARDGAGNVEQAWLTITAPRRPPDVSLKVIHLGEELYLYGGSSGAYFLGTACDDSGIRRRQTQVWIDNRPIHPMKVVEEAQGSSKPRDSLFHWAGPTDRKHGKCEEIYFGRRIDEGRHTGRIRAVDTVGLSGEATKSFDLFLAPLIREFKSHPVSLQRAGGPAFSALITDGGRDLRKQGLVLKIDGKSIGRDRIFYDPASGYFSVDGPLDLSEGRHEALLTATDDHGHRAEQRLSFTPGETVTLTASGSGQVRLKEVVLWELQDHNGDGKANPGELVRLFVTVENSGAIALEGVVGTLYSEQDLIKVTENRVTYGRLGAGETPLPLKGYDIRIQKDILKTTSSDPLHAHFRLEATSRDGSKWQLPFTLPIYLPIFPASSVTVKLNRLPRTSQSKRITVTGKASSAGSIIDRVVVYVNGKSFEAKWDASENRFSAKVSLHKGSNLIEARATDKAGAQGIAMAFTALVSPFVPPEIRISEPPNGASYNCNRPYLRGWFRTGSSGFSAIEARITRPDGLVVNIPVTVEGGEGTAYTFRSNQRLSPGDGSNQVQVVVTTTEGRRAVSLVTFSYACGGGEG